jgi:hypothetical protein
MLLLTATTHIICKKFTKAEAQLMEKSMHPHPHAFPTIAVCLCRPTPLVVVMQNQLCSCLLHFIYKYLCYLFPSWHQTKWKWLQGVDKPNKVKATRNLATSRIIALHQLWENKCQWNNSFTCNNIYHKQVILPLFLSLFLVKTYIKYWGKFLSLINGLWLLHVMRIPFSIYKLSPYKVFMEQITNISWGISVSQNHTENKNISSSISKCMKICWARGVFLWKRRHLSIDYWEGGSHHNVDGFGCA